VSHFISSASHFILSLLGLHGPWSVGFGLAAWAVAYVFLTRVITPDSIGDLMTLIVAVLPPLSFCFAVLVAIASFLSTPRHIAQGIIFVLIAILTGMITLFQYQDSAIRAALAKTAKGPNPARSTIPTACWGLFGAIIVFASELGLIFGGWQFVQGSRLWGTVWAGTGAFFVALSLLPGGRGTRNPFRKGVLALQPDDQDRSLKIIQRLLAPPPSTGVAGAMPPDWTTVWGSARHRVASRRAVRVTSRP